MVVGSVSSCLRRYPVGQMLQSSEPLCQLSKSATGPGNTCYPNCWVDDECPLTSLLLHPLDHFPEGQTVAWHGLLSGLCDGVESHQYRSVDVRVFQTKVQLSCYKWSLEGTLTHKSDTMKQLIGQLLVTGSFDWPEGRVTYRQATGNADEQDMPLSFT